jgi:hypothetical protein
MDIPRGHAMLPLTEADFLDFIFNYYKAEYSPIRSFWGTATAEPRQSQRWVSMGHELTPLSFRPANAQAQKDLESLDYFVRKRNLDSGFVRGLVIRFAKYEVHERLEKKLYESCRLDLMVRKALKEKHLIDSIWPSPVPRNIPQELLQQGVKVRQWYGDMFAKYFRSLHSVDDFQLRPEVDQKIKSSGTLMLVPFVDHLVFGNVDPIIPIVSRGAGYSNAKAWNQKVKVKGTSYGEPDRFEIRFDAPADLSDTHTRQVVRQCQCNKCGAQRDVTVLISIDPYPGPSTQTSTSSGRQPSNPNTSAPKRHTPKAVQKYTPGYVMPGIGDTVPPQITSAEVPSQSPEVERKKQCSRCTFLNHPELTICEMCQAPLPETTIISKPPSPVINRSSTPRSSHSHSASLPPPATADNSESSLKPAERPAVNRHSLSSTLFSIFPFSQQHQSEHHANLPTTQPVEPIPAETPATSVESKQKEREARRQARRDEREQAQKMFPAPGTEPSPPKIVERAEPEARPEPLRTPSPDRYVNRAEMAMMPLSPPPKSSDRSPMIPTGLPQNLMDDFVPVSPAFRDEDEDAGWGEMSREDIREAKAGKGKVEEDSDDEDNEGLIDLDAVAREEMGVWGERDEDED